MAQGRRLCGNHRRARSFLRRTAGAVLLAFIGRMDGTRRTGIGRSGAGSHGRLARAPFICCWAACAGQGGKPVVRSNGSSGVRLCHGGGSAGRGLLAVLRRRYRPNCVQRIEPVGRSRDEYRPVGFACCCCRARHWLGAAAENAIRRCCSTGSSDHGVSGCAQPCWLSGFRQGRRGALFTAAPESACNEDLSDREFS